MAESHADGAADPDKFWRTQGEAEAAAWDEERAYASGQTAALAGALAQEAAGVSIESAVVALYQPTAGQTVAAAFLAAYGPWVEQGAAYATLLRCAFGNPFRSGSFDRAWLTADVASLAQAAYEHRTLPEGSLDTQRLLVLADALEETGCTDEDILSHLREWGGVHVRGCWVLDLLLGKG